MCTCLFGCGFGAWLVTELARQVLELGCAIESLIVAGGEPFPYEVDDELLVEYLFARSAGLDPVRLDFPPEPALAYAIEAVLAETPGRLPRGRLATIGGDPGLELCSESFRRLDGRGREHRLTSLAQALWPMGPWETERVAALLSLFRRSVGAGAGTTSRPTPVISCSCDPWR